MEEEIDEKRVEEWFKKKFSEGWCKDDKAKKNKISKTGAGGAGVYYEPTANYSKTW
jgi:hypothetical protein